MIRGADGFYVYDYMTVPDTVEGWRAYREQQIISRNNKVYNDRNSVINMYKSICIDLVDDIDFYSLKKEDRKFYSSSKLYGAYNTIHNGVYKSYDDEEDEEDEYESDNIHKYKGNINDLINKDITSSIYSIINLESVDDISDDYEDGIYLKRDVEIDGKLYLSDWIGNVFTDDLSAWGLLKGEGILKIGKHDNRLMLNSDKYKCIPRKYDDYNSYISTMNIYKKYCKWQECKDILLTYKVNKSSLPNAFDVIPFDVTRQICGYL